MTKGALVVLVLGVAVAVGTGCRPGYLMRVGVEHLRYVSRARPIADEIERTDDPVRRRRLELVLRARDHAAANGLEVDGSYLEVAETEGLATAYVVTAAYADRLEPYTWSYPVVGRIPYRGYFDRADAEAFAAELAADGLDTHITEAAGYSTLGWLDDPLPSGVLAYDDVEVVTIVLHELVHQTVFVAGNIDFNETLASAVAGRLAIAFFEHRGEAARAETARRRHRLWLEQAGFLEELAGRLERHFEGSGEVDRAAMLARRAQIYRDAQPRLRDLGLVAGEAAEASSMNNAVFLAMYRYRRRAGRLDRYLASFGEISRALRVLEERVAEVEDPYAVLTADAARPADMLLRRPCCVFSCISAGVPAGGRRQIIFTESEGRTTS